MKSIVIIFLFIHLVYSINNYDAIKQIAEQEYQMACPLRGFHGLDPKCKNVQVMFGTESKDLPIRLGVGWDPIRGIRLPVFHVTFNKKNTFTTNNNVTFNIPDNYVVSKQYSMERKSITYHFPNEFFSNLDLNRTTVNGGIFAADEDTYDRIINNFGSGEQTMTIVQELHTSYSLTYEHNTKHILTSAFRKAIAYLPKKYEGNEDIYNLFLDYWGTTIVLNGAIGGLAEQITNIKECYYGQNAFNLNDQATLTMLKNLYAKQYADVNYAASYLQYSKANILEIYGGNPIIVDDWEARLKSFDEYPVFVNVTIVSILDFIDNDAIKFNVEMAIFNYYAKSKTSSDSLVNTWGNNWNSAKPVISMPTVFKGNNELYLISFSTALGYFGAARNDFNISSSGGDLVEICTSSPNAMFNYACMGFYADIRNVKCERDEQGYLYAKYEPATNTFPWYFQSSFHYPPSSAFSVEMTIAEGTHVKQGSSYIEGILNLNIKNVFGYPFKFRHYCFTGCTPVAQNVITYKANYPPMPFLAGNLVCDCPAF